MKIFILMPMPCTLSIIKVPSIGKDKPEKIVQILQEQSDLGLQCLPFHLHLLDKLLEKKTKLF